MKRKIIELSMAVFLLVGIFFLAREGARLAAGENKTYDYTVILDPGHGGSDPGKVGVHKEQEKEINLQIAFLVKELLEQENIQVIMTRESDRWLADDSSSNKKVQDLKRRCSLIHEVHPDCVISIHQNSYPDASVKGAQVFYYEDSQEGKILAEILQKHLVEALDKDNHRQAKGNRSYYLLKKTDALTVIVECGFLSHPEEAAQLASKEYQKKVASAICDGTIEYLKEKLPLAPVSSL